MQIWSKHAVVLVVAAVISGCADQLPKITVHPVSYYASRIRSVGPRTAPATAPVMPPLSNPAVLQQNPVIAHQLHILVNARERRLFVYRGHTLLASYPVAIGFAGAMPHRIRGDNKTPLGNFHIAYIRWGTEYGPFLLLSYPNRKDALWGLEKGIISRWQYREIIDALNAGQTPPQNTPLGGYIGIHGMGPRFSCKKTSKVFAGRWTAGCVALSNYDAEKLASMVHPGTPVKIVGKVPSYQQQINEIRTTEIPYRQNTVSVFPTAYRQISNNFPTAGNRHKS